jgi:hypothetical protein
MTRLITCAIGIFIFGVIYGEILNALGIFEINVNVYLFAGSIALVFLLSDFIFKYYGKRATVSDKYKRRFEKIKGYYFIFLAFLGFILMIAIPFIWWGAIKRLAVMAR